MSSGSATSRPSGQPKTGPLKTQASLKLQGRQSTPDSEALVSSDEEPYLRHNDLASTAQAPKAPVRRASWLQNDGHQVPAASLARKGSFAGSSMSPTTSLPPTPSAEPGGAIWGSLPASSTALGRAAGGAPGSNPSYPWNPSSGIWNNDRKDASSRLAEVVPSPTSTVPPNINSTTGLYGGDLNQSSSPTTREQGFTSPIPFQFPLEPSLKNIRSLSYSVGQRDPESLDSSYAPSRGRVSRPPYSGLQHRPSRPSMLSEMANDGSALGKVDEDEDDNSSGSLQGSRYMTAEQKKIDQLTRENALLRQQQQQRLLRPRASTGASYGVNSGFFSGPLPEESDYAVDELDEGANGLDRDVRDPRREMIRRMSDFPIAPLASSNYGGNYEKRNLANAKRGIWQSQLGFTGIGEISQSRRHSFADIPIPQRHNSIVSLGGDSSIGPLDQAIHSQHQSQEGQHAQDVYSSYADSSANAALDNPVQAYFTTGGALGSAAQSGYASHQQQQHSAPHDNLYPYNGGNKFYGQYHRPVSPHRSLYTMQPRPHQSLHIVLFKCNRPDVFYIQEGTGLTVKPGDLVIVEADRGTDLGTVVKDNVDWQTAKELKEHFAEEHYKWLMMYADTAGASLTAASTGATSAVGGMGPPNGHHMQEPNNGELKPKLIKRLAQTHEIQNLRDKEGSEAKAKRLCMQKVKEHNLNMEILDAEFQMDFKKLTFYYFADSYINFNSLVTDLFKIYKTRIWMSAINPASFASPSLGLTAPSGIGPGAVSIDLLQQLQERRQSTTQAADKAPTHAMSGQNGAPRGLRASNSNPSFNDTTMNPSPGASSAYSVNAMNYPSYNPYGAPFSNNARIPAVDYAPMMQTQDQYMSAYSQTPAFQLGQFGRGRFPTSTVSNAYQGQGFSPMRSEQDMFSAFNGLSLNGHQSAGGGLSEGPEHPSAGP